jgi:hypothetical protein
VSWKDEPFEKALLDARHGDWVSYLDGDGVIRDGRVSVPPSTLGNGIWVIGVEGIGTCFLYRCRSIRTRPQGPKFNPHSERPSKPLPGQMGFFPDEEEM